MTSSALVLGACGSSGDDPGKQARPVGSAEAQRSPAAENVDGDVLTLGGEFSTIDGLAVLGDHIAVRSGDKLGIGTREQFEDDDFSVVDIAEGCGELSAGATDFVLACPQAVDGTEQGGVVYLIDPTAPTLENTRTAEERFTTATQTSTGDVVAAAADSSRIITFPHDDPTATTEISMTDTVDQLVSTTYADHLDPVVVINRKFTTIQGLDREQRREGGRLRAGAGIGTVAPGEQGVFLAADTEGDQLLVYTRFDVVRLHQSMPVDRSPWAVAWDSSQQLAWVASTGTNSLVGYDLSTGEPLEQQRYSTVADATSLAVMDNGTKVLASASGDGIQFLDS
ncbi:MULTISPECIES: YncE family protein [Corynebacterium]|uniref:YncE family protein n=1 Tax=Corynebacterium TaxID=1716 RepID=UPI00124CA2C1|nr:MULTISPECIES: hypothetical protein [Corynebacterium]